MRDKATSLIFSNKGVRSNTKAKTKNSARMIHSAKWLNLIQNLHFGTKKRLIPLPIRMKVDVHILKGFQTLSS